MPDARLGAVLLLVGLLLGGSGGYFYAHNTYTPQLEEAQERIGELEAQLSTAEARISELEETIRSLEEELEYKERLVDRLNKTLIDLQGEKRRLEYELNVTLAEKERLEEQVASLEEQVSNLTAQISSLESEVDSLRALVDAYSYAVDYALEWYGLGPSETHFPDIILEAAPGSVETLAWILLSDVDSTAGRVVTVLDYIAWSLLYFNDSYVRIVDDWAGTPEVEAWDQHVMLPNETLEAGGGDCDDLALLAYALLTAYPIEGERVYIIEWVPEEGAGHAAVLVVSGEGYYILDPAGNWANWIQVYLEMVAVRYTDDRQWYIYIRPLDLSSAYKEWLLESGFARANYYDLLNDKDYYRVPPLPQAYEDPADLLYDWIVLYWGVTDLAYIGIHAPGVHEYFNNITEAAQWIIGNA